MWKTGKKKKRPSSKRHYKGKKEQQGFTTWGPFFFLAVVRSRYCSTGESERASEQASAISMMSKKMALPIRSYSCIVLRHCCYARLARQGIRVCHFTTTHLSLRPSPFLDFSSCHVSRVPVFPPAERDGEDHHVRRAERPNSSPQVQKFFLGNIEANEEKKKKKRVTSVQPRPWNGCWLLVETLLRTPHQQSHCPRSPYGVHRSSSSTYQELFFFLSLLSYYPPDEGKPRLILKLKLISGRRAVRQKKQRRGVPPLGARRLFCFE